MFPEHEAFYAVKGELGADYGAVWLANQATGERVSEKIKSRTPAER